ncbi:hypothetical protein GCM10010357_18100 [Streptomyces luteireticuli]|uniref:Uncharacterized protein n=1 Tax=Streptomyces luteireticuli TaxID=173858 RepID=A0ABN0YJ76_9ACTN
MLDVRLSIKGGRQEGHHKFEHASGAGGVRRSRVARRPADAALDSRHPVGIESAMSCPPHPIPAAPKPLRTLTVDTTAGREARGRPGTGPARAPPRNRRKCP